MKWVKLVCEMVNLGENSVKCGEMLVKPGKAARVAKVGEAGEAGEVGEMGEMGGMGEMGELVCEML